MPRNGKWIGPASWSAKEARAGDRLPYAKLVDEKMNLIATQVHTTDSFRIAVLAALHLADRCLALERQLHSIEGEIVDRSEELTALLDEACDEKEATAAIFASEALTDDADGWTDVEFGEIVFLEKKGEHVSRTVARLDV